MFRLNVLRNNTLLNRTHNIYYFNNMMRYSTKENQIHNIIPSSENNTLQKDDTTQINHIIQLNNSKDNTETNYSILVPTKPRRYSNRCRRYYDNENNLTEQDNDAAIIFAACILLGPAGLFLFFFL